MFLKSAINIMSATVYLRTSTLADLRGDTAAFINREIDGDVSSSAASDTHTHTLTHRERETGRESDTGLAARFTVSMTSNMLQSLHSYVPHAV